MKECDNTSEHPKRVTLLGATGSVGRSALDLIRRHASSFQLESITAGRRLDDLVALAKEFHPRFVAIADPALGAPLAEALSGTGIETGAGPSALKTAAEREACVTIAAITGAAGLEPTLAAVRRGGVLALANKECLVCAGPLFMEEVRKSGTHLIPVDSEHNALFQALKNEPETGVSRLVLTASGGPFRTWSYEDMQTVTPEQALAHPVWSMGAKISIDSATLMNKGLELIEAHYLFGVQEECLDILIHPPCLIHGLVEFSDGSVLAHLSKPDMRIPLAYALAFPKRITTGVAPLDLLSLKGALFEQPDEQRFPALRLARHALKSGCGMPTVLNAANEVAVSAFLDQRIKFLDIVAIVEDCMKDYEKEAGFNSFSFEDVVSTDLWAREKAKRYSLMKCIE